MAWWQSCGYTTRSLPSTDSEEEEAEAEEEEEDESSACPTDPDTADIHYVLGDVTHPHSAEGDAIIVHCVGRKHGFTLAESHTPPGDVRCVVFVDDSGWWGTGGLFTALEMRSDEPRKQYDLAGRMKGTPTHHLYYRMPAEPTGGPTGPVFQIWILGMSCSFPLMTNSLDRMAKIT